MVNQNNRETRPEPSQHQKQKAIANSRLFIWVVCCHFSNWVRWLGGMGIRSAWGWEWKTMDNGRGYPGLGFRKNKENCNYSRFILWLHTYLRYVSFHFALIRRPIFRYFGCYFPTGQRMKRVSYVLGGGNVRIWKSTNTVDTWLKSRWSYVFECWRVGVVIWFIHTYTHRETGRERKDICSKLYHPYIHILLYIYPAFSARFPVRVRMYKSYDHTHPPTFEYIAPSWF